MSTRRKPPHLCSCGVRTIPHGELCPCQANARRERNARHDQHRGTAHSRGYGSKWRAAREEYLHANPFCIMCAKEGKQTAATTVDHIIAHGGDQALFWNRNNWQSLCANHHNSHKQRIERRIRRPR